MCGRAWCRVSLRPPSCLCTCRPRRPRHSARGEGWGSWARPPCAEATDVPACSPCLARDRAHGAGALRTPGRVQCSAGTCTQPSRPCAPADLGEQPPQRHRLLHGPRGGSASRRPLQCPAELWRHPDHLGEDRLPRLPAEDGAHRRQRRSALRGPSPPQGCAAPGASRQPAHRPAGNPHPGARRRMCRRRCSLETSVSPRLPLTALARSASAKDVGALARGCHVLLGESRQLGSAPAAASPHEAGWSCEHLCSQTLLFEVGNA